MSLYSDEYVIKEYLLVMKDESLKLFLDGVCLRSIGNKTNCHIELTKRILNRRVNSYKLVKYAIIKVVGSTNSEIRQCNRLLENQFPLYRHRKEYQKKFQCCTLFADEFIPDNSALYFPSQRTGPANCQYGDFLMRSPYEPSSLRPNISCQWRDTDLKKGIVINPHTQVEAYLNYYLKNSSTEQQPCDPQVPISMLYDDPTRFPNQQSNLSESQLKNTKFNDYVQKRKDHFQDTLVKPASRIVPLSVCSFNIDDNRSKLVKQSQPGSHLINIEDEILIGKCLKHIYPTIEEELYNAHEDEIQKDYMQYKESQLGQNDKDETEKDNYFENVAMLMTTFIVEGLIEDVLDEKMTEKRELDSHLDKIIEDVMEPVSEETLDEVVTKNEDQPEQIQETFKEECLADDRISDCELEMNEEMNMLIEQIIDDNVNNICHFIKISADSTEGSLQKRRSEMIEVEIPMSFIDPVINESSRNSSRLGGVLVEVIQDNGLIADDFNMYDILYLAIEEELIKDTLNNVVSQERAMESFIANELETNINLVMSVLLDKTVSAICNDIVTECALVTLSDEMTPRKSSHNAGIDDKNTSVDYIILVDDSSTMKSKTGSTSEQAKKPSFEKLDDPPEETLRSDMANESETTRRREEHRTVSIDLTIRHRKHSSTSEKCNSQPMKNPSAQRVDESSSPETLPEAVRESGITGQSIHKEHASMTSRSQSNITKQNSGKDDFLKKLDKRILDRTNEPSQKKNSIKDIIYKGSGLRKDGAKKSSKVNTKSSNKHQRNTNRMSSMEYSFPIVCESENSMNSVSSNKSIRKGNRKDETILDSLVRITDKSGENFNCNKDSNCQIINVVIDNEVAFECEDLKSDKDCENVFNEFLKSWKSPCNSKDILNSKTHSNDTLDCNENQDLSESVELENLLNRILMVQMLKPMAKVLYPKTVTFIENKFDTDFVNVAQEAYCSDPTEIVIKDSSYKGNRLNIPPPNMYFQTYYLPMLEMIEIQIPLSFKNDSGKSHEFISESLNNTKVESPSRNLEKCVDIVGKYSEEVWYMTAEDRNVCGTLSQRFRSQSSMSHYQTTSFHTQVNSKFFYQNDQFRATITKKAIKNQVEGMFDTEKRLFLDKSACSNYVDLDTLSNQTIVSMSESESSRSNLSSSEHCQTIDLGHYVIEAFKTCNDGHVRMVDEKTRLSQRHKNPSLEFTSLKGNTCPSSNSKQPTVKRTLLDLSSRFQKPFVQLETRKNQNIKQIIQALSCKKGLDSSTNVIDLIQNPFPDRSKGRTRSLSDRIKLRTKKLFSKMNPLRKISDNKSRIAEENLIKTSLTSFTDLFSEGNSNCYSTKKSRTQYCHDHNSEPSPRRTAKWRSLSERLSKNN